MKEEEERVTPNLGDRRSRPVTSPCVCERGDEMLSAREWAKSCKLEGAGVVFRLPGLREQYIYLYVVRE